MRPTSCSPKYAVMPVMPSAPKPRGHRRRPGRSVDTCAVAERVLDDAEGALATVSPTAKSGCRDATTLPVHIAHRLTDLDRRNVDRTSLSQPRIAGSREM